MWRRSRITNNIGTEPTSSGWEPDIFVISTANRSIYQILVSYFPTILSFITRPINLFTNWTIESIKTVWLAGLFFYNVCFLHSLWWNCFQAKNICVDLNFQHNFLLISKALVWKTWFGKFLKNHGKPLLCFCWIK